MLGSNGGARHIAETLALLDACLEAFPAMLSQSAGSGFVEGPVGRVLGAMAGGVLGGSGK